MATNNIHIEARELLVKALRSEAELHKRTQLDKLGREYDQTESKLTAMSVRDKEVGLTMTFWDAWIDERNHNFTGRYHGIATDDWPELASALANYLENSSDFEMPPIIENHFRLVPPDR